MGTEDSMKKYQGKPEITAFFSFITEHRPCKAALFTREKGNFLYSCATAENLMSSANTDLFLSYSVDRSFKTEMSSNIQGYLVADKPISVIFLVYSHLRATNSTW